MRGTSFGKVNGPVQRLTRAVKIPGTYYSVYLLLDNNHSYLSLNFRQLEEQRNLVKTLTLSGIIISLKDLLSRTVVVVPDYTAKEISRLIYDDYVKISPELKAKLKTVEVVSDEVEDKDKMNEKIKDIDQKIKSMDSVLKKLEGSITMIQEQLSNIEKSTKFIESSRIIEPIEKKTKKVTDFKGISTLEDHLHSIDSKISEKRDFLDKSQVLAELEKARIYESEGNLQSALIIFQNVINSSSNNVKALLGLGRISKKLHSNNKAIEYYESVLEIEPRNAIAISDLALIYKNIGRVAEADNLVEQLMQISAESFDKKEIDSIKEDKKESIGLKTLFNKNKLSDFELASSRGIESQTKPVEQETEIENQEDNGLGYSNISKDITASYFKEEEIINDRDHNKVEVIVDSTDDEIMDLTNTIKGSPNDITIRTTEERKYTVRDLKESTLILEEPENMELSVSIEDQTSVPSDINISVITEEIESENKDDFLQTENVSIKSLENDLAVISEEKEELDVIEEIIDKKIEELDEISTLVDRETLIDKEEVSYSEEIEMLLVKARSFLDNNDFVSAAKEYTKVITEDPDNIEAIESIADFLYDNDKKIESIPYYRKLREKIPNNTIYPLKLAKVLRENDEIDEANIEYQRILNIDSNNIEALEVIGELNLKNNKLEEAFNCFTRLNKLDSENPKYQHRLANIYKKQDNFELSVYWLERALEHDSENPSIWSDLSIVYRLLGRQGDASIATKQAMELVLQSTRKTLENTRRLSTKVLLNVRGSTHEVNESISSNKEKELSEGGLLNNGDSIDNGIKAEEILESKDKELITIQSSIRNGNFDVAKKLISKKLAKNPDDVSVLKLSGNVHMSLDDYSSAYNDYNKAVQQMPNDKTLLYLTGKSLRLLNKPYQALEILKKSTLMGNESPDVYYELGLCNHSLRNFEDAIENFKYALLFDPDSAIIWSSLGATYQRLGRLDASYRAYNESLRINPDNDDIKSILKILKEIKET